MPRRPRYYLPGVPSHIIQRGNNRAQCFFCDRDFALYLEWLREASVRYGCLIHSYVLMTNHVHLLTTPETRTGISRMMQSVGRRYVQYVNVSRDRTGTLWEGRHRASLVDSERYFFICSRYIELNPVRAAMAAQPGEYRWSSYRANALGAPDSLLTPHVLYLTLGDAPATRQHAYRELFRDEIDDRDLNAIRTTASQGLPLGGDRFREQVDQQLERPISYRAKGRPKSE
jgi:putative transposase